MPVAIEKILDLTARHVAPTSKARPTPLLFVHGLWGASWLFDDWLPQAAERGWDSWALNLRGRDGSRPVDHLGKVRMQDFATDVRDALDQLGDVVLLGYSMGGLAAQMVAGDARVKALILLCAVPPRGVIALSWPVLRRSPRHLPAMIAGRVIHPSREEAAAIIMNDMSPADRDRWYPTMIADSGRAAGQIALGAISVDPASIRCPVLVVSAKDDRISPPSAQRKLVQRYAAEHVAIAGRSHLISVEQGWESVAGSILDWADRQPVD